MFKEWAIDASMCQDGLLCLVPIDENQIYTGFSYFCRLDELPENKPIVAVIHPDGQEAVERWCEENKNIVDTIFKNS